ncbi:MAG: Smr/MutS family protein [Kofleriaceae bacterium]
MGSKRSPRGGISPEDQALFMDAIGGTMPLAGRDRVPVPPKPASPVRVDVLPPTIALVVEGDGARYAARGPGVSISQTAEMRAGKVRPTATLDLHGERVDAALARLRAFLVESQRSGHRCTLIVHGKGTHSEHGAPLREAVLGDLLGPCSGFVHALATAAATDGGEGATYVMLRGRK